MHMANDAVAPAEPSAKPSEDEYQTFCAALSASARGRAFLAEYARRHRGADTETLLAALARLEMVMWEQARSGADQLRAELRGLIGTIRAARPELAQAALPARAAKLALLLDLLERRLAAMAEPAQAAAEAAQAAPLAVVPPPEEPELPIPTPAAAQPPALALAHDRGPPPLPPERPAGIAAAIPEVSWFDDARSGPARAGRQQHNGARAGRAAPAAGRKSLGTVHGQDRAAAARPAGGAAGAHRGRAHRAVYVSGGTRAVIVRESG
jgi:hypothetical protein